MQRHDEDWDEYVDIEPIIEEVTLSEGRDPITFGLLLCGIIILTFSLVLTWYNESKLVKFARFIAEASKECRVIDVEYPLDQDDYWLVHAKGVV